MAGVEVVASEAWKDFERRHARRFYNGKRILRGEDFSVSLPDGETAFEVWDCKHRQGIQAVSWFREAENKYATFTGDRRFHLALHIPGQKVDYVLCRADDYAGLVRSEGKLGLMQDLGFKEWEMG